MTSLAKSALTTVETTPTAENTNTVGESIHLMKEILEEVKSVSSAFETIECCTGKKKTYRKPTKH